ncbi:MAG: hypothetical protein ACKVQW_09170 [Pyrinomonadaceae bacterium]
MFCIPFFAFCLSSCGIPNLESTECAEARVAVKQFYSFHFGNDMRPSTENLKLRERFLTKRLYSMLAAAPESDVDPFSMTREFPRTFKIGECNVDSATSVDFRVQLYWRDDERTVQQEIVANAVMENSTWLIDSVGSKKQ